MNNADFLSIFLIAIGLSADCFAVAISASVTIGVVAFVATVIGFLLGNKAGELIGRWAETIEGVVLIGIGLRIVISHIWS